MGFKHIFKMLIYTLEPLLAIHLYLLGLTPVKYTQCSTKDNALIRKVSLFPLGELTAISNLLTYTTATYTSNYFYRYI